MTIVKKHVVKVKQLSLIPFVDNVRYCTIHEQPYSKCICPKETSSPANDGWLLGIDDGLNVTASPTQELYNRHLLWISSHDSILTCSGCEDGKKGLDLKPMTEVESQDAIEAYWDKHKKCGVK